MCYQHRLPAWRWKKLAKPSRNYKWILLYSSSVWLFDTVFDSFKTFCHVCINSNTFMLVFTSCVIWQSYATPQKFPITWELPHSEILYQNISSCSFNKALPCSVCYISCYIFWWFWISDRVSCLLVLLYMGFLFCVLSVI